MSREKGTSAIAKSKELKSVLAPVRRSTWQDPPAFLFRPVRTRLLDELERGAAQRPKVLSIVAPIGYGKTVLMSELFTCLRRQGEYCYWVGLDDRDMSVDRVLSALEAALTGADAELHPTHALFRGDEPIERRLDDLVESVSRLPAVSTIFIDNLNSCVDETLGTVLDALIFRTPASVRLVWSSTAALAINLGRAKLEGLIRQIGFADLSMDPAETGRLLGDALDDRLGMSGVAMVVRQTEGWPAAIRMAKIILEGTAEPEAALEAFSGSDEDIAAMLNRQVLQGFAPDLREFLLGLAQLRTFCVELCRHATGSEQAESCLDYLLQRNVFMIPLDRNRKWYRLHGLFRECLISEADRLLGRERIAAIQRRAAAWCERHDQWRDAIDYALAATDYPFVTRMLDRTATVFVRDRGDVQQYIHWTERLQSEGVQIGWETHFWYVWALIFHRRYEYGRIQQQALVERLRHATPESGAAPHDLPQRIAHLSICIDIFTDRLDETYRGIERWLAADTSGDRYNVASVSFMKGICLASAYRFSEAHQTLRFAMPIMLQIGGAYGIGWGALINGLLSVYEGEYARGYAELSAGLAQTRRALGEESGLCGSIALVAARCAVEMGLDADARDHLASGLRSAHSHGLVDTAAFGFDAAVKLWSGESDEFVSIPRLREIAASYPPRLSAMLSCFLVRRLIRLGRLDEALVEARGLDLERAGAPNAAAGTGALAIACHRDLNVATRIALDIAVGKARQAEALIAEEMKLARAEGRFARKVELFMSKAMLSLQCGKPGIAAKELIHAVSFAARRRIVRPFHDHAETVTTLVNDTKPSAWAFALTEEREFFVEICSGLPIGKGQKQDDLMTWSGDQALAGALTPREINLLKMIDMGLSNQQLGDRSHVSVATVKWHLQNLYRKLGVSNRTAALARARLLNVLPRLQGR